MPRGYGVIGVASATPEASFRTPARRSLQEALTVRA